MAKTHAMRFSHQACFYLVEGSNCLFLKFTLVRIPSAPQTLLRPFFGRILGSKF